MRRYPAIEGSERKMSLSFESLDPGTWKNIVSNHFKKRSMEMRKTLLCLGVSLWACVLHPARGLPEDRLIGIYR